MTFVAFSRDFCSAESLRNLLVFELWPLPSRKSLPHLLSQNFYSIEKCLTVFKLLWHLDQHYVAANTQSQVNTRLSKWYWIVDGCRPELVNAYWLDNPLLWVTGENEAEMSEIVYSNFPYQLWLLRNRIEYDDLGWRWRKRGQLMTQDRLSSSFCLPIRMKSQTFMIHFTWTTIWSMQHELNKYLKNSDSYREREKGWDLTNNRVLHHGFMNY